MLYNPPYGGATNDPYINGNPSTGTAGSIPPAAMMEYPQREIVALITDAGLTPSNSDLTQLARAVQNGVVTYAQDSGTVNNVSVTLSPVPSSLVAGLTIRVKMAYSPTGPAVINVNSIGNKAITKRNGAALVGYEWSPTDVVQLVYDGTKFQAIAIYGMPVLTQAT